MDRICVLLAKSWIVLIVVLVVISLVSGGSEVQVLWSQNPLNGCCGKCNVPNSCKSSGLETTPVTCVFVQFDKTQVTFEKNLLKSCGKPQKLVLSLSYVNDSAVLVIKWRFPIDMTLINVAGFLVIVSYNNPSVSGEVVNYFTVSGLQKLDDKDMLKLADVDLIYDCMQVLPNTKYTVTVQTMPSIVGGSVESAILQTNETDEKVIANCNSQWVALLFVKLGQPQVTVCFKSPPESLKLTKFILHVMTSLEYDGIDPRTSDNLENIDLGQGMSGKIICRNFTLTEGYYVAVLQPNHWCTCQNKEATCHHTFIKFIVPSMLSNVALSSTTLEGPTKAATTPSWHVPLISFFVSLIVVSGIVLVALYCLINGFQDFLGKLSNYFVTNSDMKVLVVFQPNENRSSNEAIKKFVCKLKWKTRAIVETVPDLEKQRNSRGAPQCIKNKSEEPTKTCHCFCCQISDDWEDVLKKQIVSYDRIVLFHSRESSSNYQVFQNTDDIPVGICSAFIKLASFFDRKSQSAVNERENLNELLDPQVPQEIPTSFGPESMEAVRRVSPGLEGAEQGERRSFVLASREDSGYHSREIKEDELREQFEKMKTIEAERRMAREEEKEILEIQTDPQPSQLVEGSEKWSIADSVFFLNRFSNLPVPVHVSLSSDEGVDLDFIRSSFNRPDILDVDKDFAEIVNLITKSLLPRVVSPSVTSEA